MTQVAKVKRNGRLSKRKGLRPARRKFRHKFGHYSILAAVPAVFVSQVSNASSDSPIDPESSIAKQSASVPESPKFSGNSLALLKSQSRFRLPHQSSGFNMAGMLSGDDDCPGKFIPAGTYSAGAPYIDSGDTSGANNTVSFLEWFFYYEQSTLGPDHVYAFTLTGRGPNPQIQISTTSATYKPLVYVLRATGTRLFGESVGGGCPAGTGNFWNVDGEVFSSISTGTIEGQTMLSLPLNVPLYLFVDSERNDATGAGPYTLRIQDVTLGAPCQNANAADCAEFFVSQHYRDFLNREPDPEGFEFWINEITSCGADAECIEAKRVNVSAAFFLSIEFQETGFLIYKTFVAALGPTRVGSTVPLILDEFLRDMQLVGEGVVVRAPGWQTRLEMNKAAYFDEFVDRSNFRLDYPPTMTSAQYVNALNTNAGGALSESERDQLVNDLTNGTKTRAQVLRAVVEDPDFTKAQFNRAFVLMQYFGYLRRNPNGRPDNNFDGYNFWLAKLNQFDGDFIDAEMVKAFVTSAEYRKRFGP